MAKKIKKQETTKKTKTYALFGDDKFEVIDEINDTSFSKKSLSVFEFIDSIFKPGKNIEETLLPYELSKFYFILNRFMSINFPLQASYLNDIGINNITHFDFRVFEDCMLWVCATKGTDKPDEWKKYVRNIVS